MKQFKDKVRSVKDMLSAAGVMLTMVFASPIFGGCDGKPVTTGRIVRLDSIVADFGLMTEAQRVDALEENKLAMSDYLFIMGYRDGDLSAAVDSLSRSAAFRIFYPDVVTRIGSLDSVVYVLGRFDKMLSENFPGMTPCRFYGVVSPFRQSVMTVDSMVYIALNHYLGADYEGYEGIDRYARRLKTRQRLPIDVAEAVVSINDPYEAAESATAAQRMLYDGAVMYAVDKLLGGVDTAVLMGYDDNQMAWARQNEAASWRKIVSDGLLFSTDPLDADRLCSPAPATSAISPYAPGRMGRYLGYRIVKSYVANNGDVSLPALLSPEFYNGDLTLVNAKYDPGAE